MQNIIGIVSSGSNWVKFGNGLKMCWNEENTMNKTISFPFPFNNNPTVLFVGFVIEERGRQTVTVTTTNFRTSSDGRNSGTNSWLAIGY